MADNDYESVTSKFACEVHWGDCDPAGIIFYPTYFRWFDAATWSYFAYVGYDVRRMRAEQLAMPLVAAQCEFRASPVHGDRCEVHSRIARWGGKSFVVVHRVLRDDGTLLAEGSETRVWSRRSAGPGSPLKGEAISEELKLRFRASP